MTRTITFELIDEGYQIASSAVVEASDAPVTVPADDGEVAKPAPITVTVVEQITLGRGIDTLRADVYFDDDKELDANQQFEAQMAQMTRGHVDLTHFYAHHRGVSRKHARIILKNHRLHVTDLNSTNGTYINNSPLEPNTPHPLREGDELRLGFLSLLIHIDIITSVEEEEEA